MGFLSVRVALATAAASWVGVAPFPRGSPTTFTVPHAYSSSSVLMMASKRSKAKPKRKAPTKISTKGFGAAAAKANGAEMGSLLQDSVYRDLYDWLSTSPKTNLRKVAVADFDGLRGVMALQVKR